MDMVGQAEKRVETCHQLDAGTLIEARVKGQSMFEGKVVETLPTMRLFWAVSPGGTRKIIELDEYEVYRLG
jgi:hypothetical protein